ncbi:hypothetical protein CBM2626_A230005 [Cupriavidus taiwanensis]|nr:hypothetical protein CBM2626_A230005 [Cupriavidus taiwanensis]
MLVTLMRPVRKCGGRDRSNHAYETGRKAAQLTLSRRSRKSIFAIGVRQLRVGQRPSQFRGNQSVPRLGESDFSVAVD